MEQNENRLARNPTNLQEMTQNNIHTILRNQHKTKTTNQSFKANPCKDCLYLASAIHHKDSYKYKIKLTPRI
jgi:hypothetical protein